MTKPEFLFMGGREARAFPKGWQHPRDERRRHIPLLPADRCPRTPEAQAAWTA